ncbi:MAG: uL22 family ribosomal protein [Candidatus Aenigmatarchaeota archaeon]
MPYTFTPKERHAKAYSWLNISQKDAKVICRVIRKKKLKVVKRLLEDLIAKRRSLKGKYYTKAVTEIKKLLESCEKNAKALGLDFDKLFVYASSHKGPTVARRRRKYEHGRLMKSTNVEIILVEKGKGKKNIKKEEKK